MARKTRSLIDTEPHSTEAERTVLGALLIDPAAIYEIDARLLHTDFYDPIHATIYNAIHQLSGKGTPPDFVTVANELNEYERLQEIGGSAFLAQLSSEVPTSSHIEQYADIVLEHSRKRQLAEIGKRITALAYEKGKSATELKDVAEREFLKIMDEPGSHASVTLAEMCSERYDHYAKLHEADDPMKHVGTRTGLAALDEKLIALAPGDLSLLAARPHMGKTSLALNIALNIGAEQQGTVGIISLEMSKEQLSDRMMGSLAGIPPWKIAKGMLSKEEFERVAKTMETVQELKGQHIHIDDDSNHSLTNIRSKARRLHMQHPLDLLIIDFLQLIRVSSRAAEENRYLKLTMISESIKQLARELGVPILALSQLSREVERRPDKRPQMSDLRDSGALEEYSDYVLMLYREGYYKDDDAFDSDEPEITELFVRKNRPHGLTGRVCFQFDQATMNFLSAQGA